MRVYDAFACISQDKVDEAMREEDKSRQPQGPVGEGLSV